MQKLQLYIQGQRVDLFKDESVSITQSIQNIKDIQKIFTDFTKTFTIPASKSNHKIFKHYYKFDIINGFDARIKVDATLELNSITFKNGKIKLEGVDLKNNAPYSYKITFFGSTVTLKDIVGEDKLQGLNLTSYDKVYSNTEVLNSFSANPLTEDVVVPLITHTKRLFYDSTSGNHEQGNLFYHGVLWSDLKYALRVDAIIQAIQDDYDLEFSDDFFNSSNEHYYNLFMWMHRKKGEVENLTGVNQSIVNGWNGSLLVDDTLTRMSNTSTLSVTGNPNNYNTYSLTLIPIPADASKLYSVFIYKDGVQVFATDLGNGNVVIDENDFDLEQGNYTVYIASDEDIDFSQIRWDINYLGFSSTYNTSDNGDFEYVSNFNFIMSQQIPEMKIIDFLTGIFKMFNLTAYVENGTGKIIVKTLDSFYSSGGSYDISKFIEVDKSAVNVALPYKEINFEQEDTKTFLSAIHEQKFGSKWGKKSYNGGENLDGSIYNIKTPFSQLKYERIVNENGGGLTNIQWGYFVDDNQDPYIGKPLLFYPTKPSTQTTISFLTSETNHISLANYNIPSNSVSLKSSTSKKNINYRAEVNEYTGTNDFTDTLFEVFYKNYITSVFNPKNRITKVTAYLPLRILLNFTLADRFVINSNSYKINTITTNLENGKSEIELLNDL